MRNLSRSVAKDKDDEVLDLAKVLIHYGFTNLPDDNSGWKKIKCDFHGERRASATVNLELGFYKCFVCDFSGDALKIIQLAEQQEGRKCDFSEACRIYEDVTGRKSGRIRSAASGEYRGRMAGEQRSYEEGDGFLSARLRRNTHEG